MASLISAKHPELQRAWSVLQIKSFDEKTRAFDGIATTPSTDRMDDVVEPMGAVFRLPIPMLWQHGRGFMGNDPVGDVTSAIATPSGIRVSGTIHAFTEPPSLKDDIDRVWTYIKSKAVRGLSIGFNPLEAEPIKGTYGTRFKKWEFLELSPVTIPANQDASITTIKSIDERLRRAAPGRSAKPPNPSPGASGKPNEPPQGGFSLPEKGNQDGFDRYATLWLA